MIQLSSKKPLTFNSCNVSLSFKPLRKYPNVWKPILLWEMSKLFRVWFLGKCFSNARQPNSASPFHDRLTLSNSTFF